MYKMVGRINNKRQKGTRELIEDIFKGHTDWNARQIYDRYLILIGDPNNAVTLNAVQKQVQRLREKYREIKELDAPWHLGLIAQYDIPTEAVPYILMVQNQIDENSNKLLSTNIYQVLTIRQVLWIARLYGIFGDYHQIKNKDKPKVVEVLYELAKAYAMHEITCHLSGTPFNTTDLDKKLRKGEIPEVSIPVVAGSQWVIRHRDNTFTIDPETAKKLNNSQKEGEK